MVNARQYIDFETKNHKRYREPDSYNMSIP